MLLILKSLGLFSQEQNLKYPFAHRYGRLEDINDIFKDFLCVLRLSLNMEDMVHISGVAIPSCHDSMVLKVLLNNQLCQHR